MSEEEKKAIEYLKTHIIPCYGHKGRIEFMLNDTILNLIEKQQKEIEKYEKYYKCERNLLDNYISKDKIKEKIEKWEDICKTEQLEGLNDNHAKYWSCFEDVLGKIKKELLEGE